MDRILYLKGGRRLFLFRYKLGDTYVSYPNSKYPREFRVIKVTPCGYNLLDVNTDKCVLKRHMYPSKKIHPVDGSFASFVDMSILCMVARSLKVSKEKCG